MTDIYLWVLIMLFLAFGKFENVHNQKEDPGWCWDLFVFGDWVVATSLCPWLELWPCLQIVCDFAKLSGPQFLCL